MLSFRLNLQQSIVDLIRFSLILQNLYKMYHYCGAESTESGDRIEEDIPSELDARDPASLCKFCGERIVQQECLIQDGPSPVVTPTISPDSLLDSLDTGQKYLKSSFASPLKGFATRMAEDLEDSRNNQNICSIDDRQLRDVKILGAGDCAEGTEGGTDGPSHSFQPVNDEKPLCDTFDFETDPSIWLPPDPEDMEDNVEGTVVNYDDDDECSDVAKWGKPSSLGRLCEKRSSKFKEDFQKAMTSVMNGKFKSLVTELLESEGICIPKEAGENWLDLVTSLSWEAALLIKPDTVGGKIVDLDGHVKVKCIATGLRSESKVINGMVFKKSAAHKIMLTNHKNPKFLLLKGILGQGTSALSSFDSMEKEKDDIKSIVEMIEMCHPNVVLVEKTVSRDVQESFLAKGITLAFDMKLHRLERIARYTGSQIFSSADSLMSQKLKQCESLYFEKFVEEHGIGREGGRKPVKTLMFLEGCHRPLGSTPSKGIIDVVLVLQILLKGAHSDALKKIKSVVHSAVVLAYHLILEASFRVDQRAMFLTICSAVDDECSQEHLPNTCKNAYSVNDSLSEIASSLTMDIPISEGTSCNYNMDMEQNSAFTGFSNNITSYEKETGQNKHIHRNMSDDVDDYQLESPRDEAVPTVHLGSVLSAISASVKKVVRDRFTLSFSPSHHSFSSNFHYKEREPGQSMPVLPLHTPSEESTYFEIEVKDNADLVVSPDTKSLGSILACNEIPIELCKANECSVCGDPLQAHVYNYLHQSGKLMIRVKQLSVESSLPGEAEGKLWMWAQCSKCVPVNQKQRSTRRVVMSSAAHDLSFGKFLELGFSVHSDTNESSCGHSLQRDYHHFYGLGAMVTMFTYSSVNIYTACMPPPVLEFNNPNGQLWINKEAETVWKRGMLLFNEVANLLQNRKSEFCSSHSKLSLDLTSLLKKLSEVEEMLNQERFEFEAKLQEINNKNEHLGKAVHEPLILNRLIQELLLESYVWDWRLQLLLSSDFGNINTNWALKSTLQEVKLMQRKDGIEDQIFEGKANSSEDVSDGKNAIIVDHSKHIASSSFSDCDYPVNRCGNADAELEIKSNGISAGKGEHSFKGFQASEHQYELFVPESGHLNNAMNSFADSQADGRPTMGGLNIDSTTHNTASAARGIVVETPLGQDSPSSLSHLFPSLLAHDRKCQEKLPVSEPLQININIPVVEEKLKHNDSVTDMSIHNSEFGEASSTCSSKGLDRGASISQKSLVSKTDDSQGWAWKRFSEICKDYSIDLQRGYLQKFEFTSSYTPGFLPSAYQLNAEEGSRLHIPLGPEKKSVLAYEGELTSIIACALAWLHERDTSTEDLLEKDARKEKRNFKRGMENVSSLDCDISVASSYWSSNGSLDSEGINSGESVSSEESYTSFSSVVHLKDPHPEIHLGVQKSPQKGKYSVMCLYEKQFHDLRRHCCPCELDYISSLSRCKNWDAKGGKSGSLFVKTLDDRFVIKQIQKKEYDSFVKFAHEYFKYTNQSLNSGSQTCLAKILGIYQVTIRQPKSGKDLKYELMVMENLLFGKNITRLYDLKGSEYARYTSNANGIGEVLLDGNFVEDMNVSPLYVSGKTKHALERALWNDTSFLTSINVMDYSLLVGVDMQQRELVCGIIDYLRQYTWEKQLETLAKASIVPRHATPTVVSPVDYKKRFRKFMSLHFISVPGHWCPETSAGPCKCCGDRSNSFQLKNELTENS
ncbi:hypothetical protein IFM89_037082 [Coptis chinensis]|uniref:1-phosphatidylinositol-3-phosphate 5-kinase n=1 Tax=Coptis chinensis TaxID=261450 RepID=A0A835HUN8_9MAGN|nr:hypothetical protein IFM89_037082 [Coptis chinensis]